MENFLNQIPNQPSNQASNPLDQLRDIQLPQDVSYIELAPGWWFLIILTLFLVAFYFYRRNKKRNTSSIIKRKKSFYLTPAHEELNQLAKLPASHLTISQLSALLKRVCLLSFPKQQVASLSGETWIQFLNQQTEQEFFNLEQQKAFSDLMYKKEASIDNQFWQALIQNSRLVIDQVLDPKPCTIEQSKTEQANLKNLPQEENN